MHTWQGVSDLKGWLEILYHPWIEITTIPTAFAAIFYAVKQRSDSEKLKNHSQELRDESSVLLGKVTSITNEMTSIAGSLSTRYVGLFPKNMDDMIEVITKAEQRLDIMLDIAAYGHYSNPEDYLKYFQTLESLSQTKGVVIRLIAYDKVTARKGHRTQYNGEKGFEDEKQQARFVHFFDRVHQKKLKKPENYQEFDDLMMSQEEMWEKRFQGFTELVLANEPLRFFLWLADEKEAIFCFENYGRDTREISFRTRDVSLIRTFKDIFDQNWDKFKTCPTNSPIQKSDAAATT